jgi:hypothetical protein
VGADARIAGESRGHHRRERVTIGSTRGRQIRRRDDHDRRTIDERRLHGVPDRVNV